MDGKDGAVDRDSMLSWIASVCASAAGAQYGVPVRQAALQAAVAAGAAAGSLAESENLEVSDAGLMKL